MSNDQKPSFMGIPIVESPDVPSVEQTFGSQPFGSWDDVATITATGSDGKEYLLTPRQVRELKQAGRIKDNDD